MVRSAAVRVTACPRGGSLGYISRGHVGGLGAVFERDWVYGDVTQLVTFLQNHDVCPDNDFVTTSSRTPSWLAWLLEVVSRSR